MNDKTGGPAFPIASEWNPAGDFCGGGYLGLTLRDYFAAKAMQGLLSQPDERYFSPLVAHTVNAEGQTLDEWRQSICEADAKHAYMMADAMIKEGEK